MAIARLSHTFDLNPRTSTSVTDQYYELYSHLSIHIFVHGIIGCCFEIIVGSVGDFSNKAVRGARAVTGK